MRHPFDTGVNVTSLSKLAALVGSIGGLYLNCTRSMVKLCSPGTVKPNRIPLMSLPLVPPNLLKSKRYSVKSGVATKVCDCGMVLELKKNIT